MGGTHGASLGTRDCAYASTLDSPGSLALCSAPSLADGLTALSAAGNSLLDLLCLSLPRDTADCACHRIPASGTVPGSEQALYKYLWDKWEE